METFFFFVDFNEVYRTSSSSNRISSSILPLYCLFASVIFVLDLNFVFMLLLKLERNVFDFVLSFHFIASFGLQWNGDVTC